MGKTIFEKIIDREISADIVYEDEICLAFLDIHPVQYGHTLVITKKPYPWIQEVPDDQLSHSFIVSKNLVNKIKTATNCDYVKISIVGKDVPHFHIHLIPQYLGTPPRPNHTPYQNNQKLEMANKIRINVLN